MTASFCIRTEVGQWLTATSLAAEGRGEWRRIRQSPNPEDALRMTDEEVARFLGRIKTLIGKEWLPRFTVVNVEAVKA